MTSPSTTTSHSEAPAPATGRPAEGEKNEVRDLLERLVEAIAAQAEAAVQRAQEDASAEIARHLAQVEDLQAEIESARLETTTMREQLEEERAARESAEESLQELKEKVEIERGEASKLARALEARSAETRALSAALDVVRRAVTMQEADGSGHASKSGQVSTAIASGGADNSRSKPSHVSEADDSADAEGPILLVKTGDADPEAIPDGPEAELIAYARRLLSDVEEMYHVDRESIQDLPELVSRLSGNLRYARQLLVNRASSADSGESIFKQEFTTLLDLNAASEFGRHLSFSGYDLYPDPHKSAHPLGL